MPASVDLGQWGLLKTAWKVHPSQADLCILAWVSLKINPRQQYRKNYKKISNGRVSLGDWHAKQNNYLRVSFVTLQKAVRHSS